MTFLFMIYKKKVDISGDIFPIDVNNTSYHGIPITGIDWLRTLSIIEQVQSTTP